MTYLMLEKLKLVPLCSFMLAKVKYLLALYR
jgi:hypothetical protein